MYSKTITSSLFAASLVLAAASGAAPAFAAGAHSGGHGGKKGHAMSFGEPGKASAVSRTIEIKMFDNYYEPKEITVKAGETIRFVVKNVGEFVHEFNIGTAAMHAAHQEEMMTMMEHGMLEVDKINHDKMKMDGHSMAHDDPNSVLLEPGKSDEIIWKFAEADSIEFACNVPGHYDSGMMGPLKIHHQ